MSRTETVAGKAGPRRAGAIALGVLQVAAAAMPAVTVGRRESVTAISAMAYASAAVPGVDPGGQCRRVSDEHSPPGEYM